MNINKRFFSFLKSDKSFRSKFSLTKIWFRCLPRRNMPYIVFPWEEIEVRLCFNMEKVDYKKLKEIENILRKNNIIDFECEWVLGERHWFVYTHPSEAMKIRFTGKKKRL